MSNATSETKDIAAENLEKMSDQRAHIEELATELTSPLLLMEAVQLTFYAPPVTVMFSLDD